MEKNLPHIYLASRSPRRSELLHQIGVCFEPLLGESSATPSDRLEIPDPDETPLPSEDPTNYVVRLAREKAETGWKRFCQHQQQLEARPILAADTTVILDGVIFGKPESAAEAEQMLRALSGRTHRVLTAIAVALHDRVEQAINESEVSFAELSDDEIRQYIESGEPFDKAGGYGIQGRAAAFIYEIRGSYSGVMGLPLYETAQLLRRFQDSA